MPDFSHMNRISVTHLLPLLALLLAINLSSPAVSADALRERATAVFGVIEPVTRAETEASRAALGRALFWDTRLSANGSTACASCHSADDWGSDRRPQSLDARGKLTGRHSQSVFNAMSATAGLRWLADRATGADQALGSITGSMGFDSRDELVALLHSFGYQPAFEQAWPGDLQAISAEHYAQAMQAYQETLRTPAPFDDWLNGDDTALDERQRRGLESFVDRGCAACHSGPMFGGGSLQRFGVVEDYRPLTGSKGGDKGLMDKTGNEADRDTFRVQPLRNVAHTAPYFHDGSVAELGDAVSIMARVQLGQALSPDEVQDIAHFLEALSGPVPAHYAPPAVD